MQNFTVFSTLKLFLYNDTIYNFAHVLILFGRWKHLSISVNEALSYTFFKSGFAMTSISVPKLAGGIMILFRDGNHVYSVTGGGGDGTVAFDPRELQTQLERQLSRGADPQPQAKRQLFSGQYVWNISEEADFQVSTDTNLSLQTVFPLHLWETLDSSVLPLINMQRKLEQRLRVRDYGRCSVAVQSYPKQSSLTMKTWFSTTGFVQALLWIILHETRGNAPAIIEHH